jgi:site-specific DNA-methyltransferase (adenine-specific)
MDLMARYPDKHFELAIVDPPYGIGEDGSGNKSRGKRVTIAGNKSKQHAIAKDYTSFSGGDKNPASVEFFNELKRVSVNQIIWGANHFIQNIPSANSPSWVVWNKKNGECDFADCELAYTSFKTAVRMFEFKWAGMMQEDMANKEKRIHPTQKPVALYKWLLHKYAKPGDKILDTHLGSGSIAIACHDYNFDLTGCELHEGYYKEAIKRIETHTSQLKLF